MGAALRYQDDDDEEIAVGGEPSLAPAPTLPNHDSKMKE
jgi:hypothetical protein